MNKGGGELLAVTSSIKIRRLAELKTEEDDIWVVYIFQILIQLF